jgi:hypothetical protein
MLAAMDGSDDRGDIRWLTYAELGQVRGISTASATRLAFRRKWRRQPGNDGIVRVAVPAGEDQPRSDKPHDDMGDDRADIMRLVSALEAAIATAREREQTDAATITGLREQLAEAIERAKTTEARAERADAALTGERAKADALRERLEAREGDLDMARTQAATAHEALKALRQADDARKARGLMARLRAAVRGE